jgi:hypothetical protein
VRLVLFGMPAAGKSSLLGALVQAAETQPDLLNGRLLDIPPSLAEQRRRLYDQGAHRTAEEVVPYPVVYEPLAGDGRSLAAHERLAAEVIDCDGRVANELLQRRESLAEGSPQGALAREVLDADALVLAVDASAPPEQLEADFREFDRFLRLLEQDRSARAEVGGLPVFLVLTKCDLLARSGDTAVDWMERIEQRKREVDGQFRAFLARRNTKAGPLPFGRLDLHLWATAVKRPALAGSPAKPHDPYAVAELFRQALSEAAAFRRREHRAHRRLMWTVAASAGTVAALLAVSVGLYIKTPPAPQGALGQAVETLRFTDRPTAAERLRHPAPQLRRRLAELLAVRDDADFVKLPVAEQEFVGSRQAELDEYLSYLDRLEQAPRPEQATSVEALQEIKESLTKDLALPHPDEWADSEAGRMYRERVQEADALARAVADVRGWYDENLDAGRDLWSFARHRGEAGAGGINWRTWDDEVGRLLDPSRSPPFKPEQPLPGPATLLTCAAAYRFTQVMEARADWEELKRRLRRLRDLASALGLVAAKDRPAVLVVPRPPDFRLEDARARVQELERAYPAYQTEFVLANLPDAVVPEVRQAARTNYDYLLDPARAAVLRQVRSSGAGDEESPARWAAVGKWLAGGPEELAAWRRLALVLARMNDAEARDPAAVLTAFLQRPTFTLNIQRLSLEVPDTQRSRPAPTAGLTISHRPPGGEEASWTFEPAGEPRHDTQRRAWVFPYRPRDRQQLTYRPGDGLRATLPLRDDQSFVWDQARTATFQFECLTRAPRLKRANDAAGEGSAADGVRLVVSPEGGVPALPDLLPATRPERAR